MSGRRLFRWGGALAVGIVLVWGLTYVFGPHPVYGPARPVDLAEQQRMLKPSPKPPLTETFPQLAVTVIPASTSEATAAQTPDSAISISGRVTDKNTGAAIAGATLSMVFAAATTYSATSDADGRYTLGDIGAVGDMVFFASAEGYSSMEADLDRIVPGGTPATVNFALVPATGRIAGHVLTQAREPIPGAVVEVITSETGGGQVAFSDETGAFSIALDVADEVVLKASKPGYGRERFEGIVAGMESLELILSDSGAIAGRVTDEHDAPMEGLSVVALMELQGSVWSVYAKTGADGGYRLDDLSSSYTYTVRVTTALREDPPPTSEPLTGLAAYVQNEQHMERKMAEMNQTMMPDSGLAGQSGVQVRPGQTTTVDLRINGNEANTALVYGRITDPSTGGPVCPMTLQGFWDESMASAAFLGFTTTNVDGTYELYLPAVIKREKVWIRTGWDGSKPAACVEADPKVPTELNLTVPAPIVVPVRCVGEDGEPRSGLMLGYRASGTTDAQGRATVFGLSPYAAHRIAAFEGKFEGRVPSARVGLSAPFSGNPGEEVPEVTIVCSDQFGAITGQIVVPPEAVEFMTGDGAPYLFGHLLSDESEAAILDTTLDGENRFTFDRVGTGKFKLKVFLGVRRVEARRQWWALYDVEILPNQTLDLGQIHLNVSEDPL